MEDALEDEAIGQLVAAHMRLATRLPLGRPGAARLMRFILGKPEVLLLSGLVLLLWLSIQSVEVWVRQATARLARMQSLLLSPLGGLGLGMVGGEGAGGLGAGSMTPPGGQLAQALGLGLSGLVDGPTWQQDDGHVAVFAVQGGRPKMEDRFVAIRPGNGKGGGNGRVGIYAVFDGHGGEFAADYAKDILIPRIQRRLENLGCPPSAPSSEGGCPPPAPPTSEEKQPPLEVGSRVETMGGGGKSDGNGGKLNGRKVEGGNSNGRKLEGGGADGRKLEGGNLNGRKLDGDKADGRKSDVVKPNGDAYGRVLTEEILSVDSDLVREARRLGDIAGTTALLALDTGDQLVVANVGDSRGVMCDARGQAVPLSFDHKPQQLKEQRRIKEAGGFVAFNGVWRVAGVLATSRAMGDYPLKERQLVVAEPDVLTFSLPDVRPQFALLASDGLWDTVSNEEAVTFVRQRLHEPLKGARSLAMLALRRGSLDNITVIIIDFRARRWTKAK